VDWNMIALRAQDTHARGRLASGWRADARATVTNVYVDYQWEFEAGGDIAYKLTPRFGVAGASSWRVVGTDDTRGRGTQFEGRLEAAIRLEGSGAAAELFIGAERRLDPYPIEFGTANWFLAGFRLESR
jgi:hypothetical protein